MHTPVEKNPAERAESELVYLYGFARSGAAQGVEAPGIDAGPGEDPSAATPAYAVEELERDGVAAVWAAVPRREFEGEAAESNMQDLAWVTPRVLRHEEVLEKVMPKSPVLPAGFGTVFSSEQALREVMEEHRDRISALLDEFADKEEWSVKGYMDVRKGSEWLMSKDPTLHERKKSLSGPPGARYFQQKKLQTEAKKRSKRECRAVAGEIGEQLAELALDARPLKHQARDITGKKEDMVLNRAYLLLKGEVAAFRASVGQIAEERADQGLILETSGPWPPYSFCPRIGEMEQ